MNRNNVSAGEQRPPFSGVEGLVAEKQGFERLVVDCSQARWDVGVERFVYATLDFGEIGLVRRAD